MKIFTQSLIVLFTFIFKTLLFAQGYDQAVNSSASGQEGEAHIAINPLDSNKLVVGFMQTGSAVGFKIFHSSNGGDSWQESQLNISAALQDFFPSYTPAGGGDIVFAYDKEGTLYCSWIYLLANPSDPNYLSNLLWRSFWAKSTDNGQTFTFEDGDKKFFGKGVLDLSSGQLQIVDTETGICDRQWMAVDMTDGSYSNRTYISFLQGSISYGFGLVVKTLNNQSTAFENPVLAYEGAIQHANIRVDKNGILHCSFINTEQNTVLYINSSDGGQTFSDPYLIYQGISLMPNSNNIVINNRESGAPSLAIDGDDNLHLVWSDIDSTVISFYSKSTDNGQSWTDPQPLTDYFNDMVFMPVVSAKENKVSIGGNIVNDELKSEYKIIYSRDYGQTFLYPKLMSTDIIDFDAVGQDVFVGDYSSAVRTYCNIYSLWTHCVGSNCQQYVAKYDECNSTSITEHTPINSTFSIDKIYPNPATENVFIELQSENNEQFSLEILNLKGQKIFYDSYDIAEGENRISIDLSKIAKGNYLLKVKNESGIFISRTIIKQ